MRPTPALLFLMLATLLLAACGGSEEAVKESGPAAGGGTSAAAAKQWGQAPEMGIDQERSYSATLHTSEGTIVVDLLPKDAPVAVNNFVFLAREGFYDGVPFHRIVEGFMVQTGDPTGTGAGGPGYTIRDDQVTRDYTRGTLAMANTGQPNSAGSQFFIVHQDASHLPKTYAIFGKVRDGLSVVDAIASVPVEPSPSGESSKPTREVLLERVEIAEGADAGKGGASESQ